MQLDILLEPAGAEADNILQEWFKFFGLHPAADGPVEVSPDRCLEVLVELRSRCYDRGLTVNVKFTGKED